MSPDVIKTARRCEYLARCRGDLLTAADIRREFSLDLDDTLKGRLQIQVETFEALDSIRAARREQAKRNLLRQFPATQISEQMIFDEMERLGAEAPKYSLDMMFGWLFGWQRNR